MKTKLLIFGLLLSSTTFFGQQLKAEFEKKIDTVQSDNKKEILVTFNIKVPKQPAFEGAKITWSVDPTDVSINESEIFFPLKREITVLKDKDLDVPFSIKFQRKNTRDRIIKIKLTAKKDNTEIPIDPALTSEYVIFVKPSSEDPALKKKKGYELWLYTGTNLDLIDGIKAEDLYFKANYLANIKTKGNKSTRSWINIDFGRNRYFNDIDSLSGMSFNQRLPILNPDSLRVVVGEYKTVKKVETNNTFVDIYYLWNATDFSSETSKLFLTGGFSLNSQSIKTTYKNSVTVSDTITYPAGTNIPSRFGPMYRNTNFRQNNKAIGFGFVYILDEEKINVKTSLVVGLNNFVYPNYVVYNGDAVVRERYTSNPTAFLRFRFEGTVLNPGISLGFETFLRGGSDPLYNVTLTKTIDFEQLATLFGTLPTATVSK